MTNFTLQFHPRIISSEATCRICREKVAVKSLAYGHTWTMEVADLEGNVIDTSKTDDVFHKHCITNYFKWFSGCPSCNLPVANRFDFLCPGMSQREKEGALVLQNFKMKGDGPLLRECLEQNDPWIQWNSIYNACDTALENNQVDLVDTWLWFGRKQEVEFNWTRLLVRALQLGDSRMIRVVISHAVQEGGDVAMHLWLESLFSQRKFHLLDLFLEPIQHYSTWLLLDLFYMSCQSGYNKGANLACREAINRKGENRQELGLMLRTAAGSGKRDLVRALLATGDIPRMDWEIAIQNDCTPTILLLLLRGAKPLTVAARSDALWHYCLHKNKEPGFLEGLKALVDNGPITKQAYDLGLSYAGKAAKSILDQAHILWS